MEQALPGREAAFELLREYNRTDRALRHALHVEAVMRHFARAAGEDPDQWGLVGLLHDLDYEQFPAEHCVKSREILAAHGYPPVVVRAVVSHGWGLCSDVAPESRLERTLYAVDELAGLVVACALVRPSRSLADLEVRSVRKKWGQKSFAAGVDRAVIEKGAAMLGVELDALIGEVIVALRDAAVPL